MACQCNNNSASVFIIHAGYDLYICEKSVLTSLLFILCYPTSNIIFLFTSCHILCNGVVTTVVIMSDRCACSCRTRLRRTEINGRRWTKCDRSCTRKNRKRRIGGGRRSVKVTRVTGTRQNLQINFALVEKQFVQVRDEVLVFSGFISMDLETGWVCCSTHLSYLES